MSPLGYIDPELHGLLDEIVADPRSALRLTPRKALSNWIFSEEIVKPPHSATRAEHHLIEAHREALAVILIQASRVAFWKAPGLGISVDSASGSRIPRVTESELESRVAAESRQNPELDPNLTALLGTWPLRAGQALDMARASLALVPSDEARYAVAVALPESEPDGAIRILKKLVERQEKKRSSDLACRVLSTLGSRLALSKRFESARSVYSRCRDRAAIAVFAEYYIANLSCYLGDSISANEAARRIALDPTAGGEAVDHRRVLSLFAITQDPGSLQLAKKTFRKLAAVPATLMTACEALR
jgi:hypothetical protein